MKGLVILSMLVEAIIPLGQGRALMLKYRFVTLGCTLEMKVHAGTTRWLAYAVLDYAQTGLIAAVFFFKMMEWWYQSAEERMSAPTVYPPPPKVAKEGIQLPPDRTLCPLCLQKCTNPSVMAVAGFVFCYTCMHI